MKNAMLLISFLFVDFYAHAVDFNKCPQNVQDIMTNIANETSASHDGYYNQLGEKRAVAIYSLAEILAENSTDCNSAAKSLEYLGDNFKILFKIK